jgi:hypothetical protein
MFAIACDNRQKVTVVATPNGPIDGALRVTVQSGDGDFAQNPATPLSIDFLSGTIAGQTQYLVEGDVRAGAEVVLISEVVELTVSAAEATGFGLAVGSISLK